MLVRIEWDKTCMRVVGKGIEVGGFCECGFRVGEASGGRDLGLSEPPAVRSGGPVRSGNLPTKLHGRLTSQYPGGPHQRVGVSRQMG